MIRQLSLKKVNFVTKGKDKFYTDEMLLIINILLLLFSLSF